MDVSFDFNAFNILHPQQLTSQSFHHDFIAGFEDNAGILRVEALSVPDQFDDDVIFKSAKGVLASGFPDKGIPRE